MTRSTEDPVKGRIAFYHSVPLLPKTVFRRPPPPFFYRGGGGEGQAHVQIPWGRSVINQVELKNKWNLCITMLFSGISKL